MTDPILDVRNLQVQFSTDEQPVKAVDGISFSLQPGQTLGIVGESGSGKSVTALAAMGLVPPPGKISGGEIWLRDADSQPVNLLTQNMQSYRGDRIGMIFQEPMTSLNPVFTIGFQIVEAIREHQKISVAEARRLAVARLQEVRLLPSDAKYKENYLESLGLSPTDDRATKISQSEIDKYANEQKQAMLKRYPHELSGGQLQRVTIAMAIACDPKILIADEPSTALDVTVQAELLKLLRQLRDSRGMSMLFITHDLGVIAEIADVVAVMYRGKIVEYGPVLQIFSQPQSPYTKGLLACRPRLDRVKGEKLLTVSEFMEVATTDSGEWEIREKPTAPEKLEGEIVYVSDEADRSQSESSQPDVLLEVRNLRVGFRQQGVWGQTKRYFWAVNDVSFEVYRGETLGLVGESGCGKTTLARTLLRLIPPMSGTVVFDGQDLAAFSGKRLQSWRQNIQIVFQNPFSSLNPRMKIGEAIAEPLLIHKRIKNWRQARDRVVELLEDVGLNPSALNRYPHQFSGGQRQRVCIARALALYPKFIICDESVSALDVSVQAEVLNLLKELQQKFKMTYIFISHDLSVVKFMSDRLIVMNQGKIEEMGSAEQIYREPTSDYTRKLIASIPTGNLERIEELQAQRAR
jgi:peptide/nickel transport system ATP-binding protein